MLPDIYSGFREFTPDALKEMMVSYASLSGQNGVLKTKLNKLLWYGDFLHFSDHSVSISGAEYVHLPYGPVPDNYERYLYELCADGALLATEKCFSPEYIGENITAVRKPRPDFLPPTASDILAAVYRYFKAFTTKRITECSHAEKGYIETEMLERISYAYADSLRIRLKRN
ncbi:MAG: Panacea domain-containing protein [Blastocatellia bacterium]